VPWLNKLAGWVAKALLPWGAWGLGLAAVFDSSFLPLPGGVDLWMMTLSARYPARASLYVLITTMGSLIGASIFYFAVRKGEDAFLGNRVSEAKMGRARRHIERYGSWAIVIAALLPPPAPFKLFVLSAGLFRFPWIQFALALIIGRAVRYSLEAILAVRYGRQAWRMLLLAGPGAFIVAALACLLLVLLLRHRRRAGSHAA
jgi:membrane protein YqaA with SNARE-associated domain